jgi:cysteine desulfurase
MSPTDRIYLDFNATTPVRPEVWEAMRPHLAGAFGNPASSHWAGRRARQALEDARERTAALLGAFPDEVVFTSGATEANNLALFGLAGDPPGHLLVSPVEHPCVHEPLEQLAGRGFTLDRLPVGGDGVIPVNALEPALRPDTRLVSAMLANHETGVLQPVQELARQWGMTEWGMGNEKTGEGSSIPHCKPAFHCDAAQAVGKMPVHFHDLGVTALTASAHKFHGPPGVGVLLLRRGRKLRPLVWGGHQQQGRRPGTESAALAVGLACALELAAGELAAAAERVARLRRRLLDRLRESAAPVVVNGAAAHERGEALPHTLNVSFPGCQADALLMSLDLAGVACSTGSACSSGSLLPSPVLRAMGVPEDVLYSAMRFSLDAALTDEEIDRAAGRIAGTAARLRQASGEWGMGNGE